MSGLELFHFLRPAWLLVIPVLLWLGWLAHRRESAPSNALSALPEHLGQALTMGQRVGVIQDGKIVAVGAPRDLYKVPAKKMVKMADLSGCWLRPRLPES